MRRTVTFPRSSKRCRAGDLDSSNLGAKPKSFKVATCVSMWELTFYELLAHGPESCDSFLAFSMDESIQCQQGARVRRETKPESGKQENVQAELVLNSAEIAGASIVTGRLPSFIRTVKSSRESTSTGRGRSALPPGRRSPRS